MKTITVKLKPAVVPVTAIFISGVPTIIIYWN